jgi:hypothetical protein
MKYRLIGLFFLMMGCAYAMPGVAVAPSRSAQNLPQTKGKVQALIVVGDVQLIGADGTASPLKRGQTFEEGYKVVASKGGNALLVFSNGATVKVKEETEMTVVTFRQAPYDQNAEGKFLRLTKDPSQSNVEIKLKGGSFQGEVKKLNAEAGSTFLVDTPTGVIHWENTQWRDGTAPRSAG